MRRIDTILVSHGLELRDGAQFEILTRCPLCGSADPSQHLSVSTRGRGWRCLRNDQHRGKSYARLLTLLLGVSEDRAHELLGTEARPLPDADEFKEQWRRQLGMATGDATRPTKISFPREFRPLVPGAPRSAGFWDYLFDRGFTRKEAEWAADAYDLQYATSGRYAYRIIVPIYSAARQLISWTGRSIRPDASLRYLTPRGEDALAPTASLLLGLPMLWRAAPAHCLVVNEGPFDAIAVSVLGHEAGVYGTCLFGLNLSEAQADLLAELDGRFDRLRITLDPKEAVFRTLRMRSWLPRRCKPVGLLPGCKDPGELLKHEQGREFVLSLAA